MREKLIEIHAIDGDRTTERTMGVLLFSRREVSLHRALRARATVHVYHIGDTLSDGGYSAVVETRSGKKYHISRSGGFSNLSQLEAVMSFVGFRQPEDSKVQLGITMQRGDIPPFDRSRNLTMIENHMIDFERRRLLRLVRRDPWAGWKSTLCSMIRRKQPAATTERITTPRHT